jgi:hypothetical protein
MYLEDVADGIARDSKPEAIVLAHIPIGVVCPAFTTSAARNQMRK